jgi:hypothetical protein
MTAFRRLAPLLALAGFLSLLVAVTGSGSPAPLQIAVEGPQTGSQAPNGRDQLRGVQLAVSQLNAHGGLWNGRKVAIIRANDKAEASRGKAVARRVIAKGIRFVIGPQLVGGPRESLDLPTPPRPAPVDDLEDKTGGIGATVQPMNSQIAPIEARYVEKLRQEGRDARRRHRERRFHEGNGDSPARGAAEGRRLGRLDLDQGDDRQGAAEHLLRGRGLEGARDEARPGLREHVLPRGSADREGACRGRCESAVPDGPRERRQRLRAQTTLSQAQRLRLQRRTRGDRDAVRQDVCRPVPSCVRQEASVKLVHVRLARGSWSMRPPWVDELRATAGVSERGPQILRRTKGIHGATGTIAINSKTGYRKIVPVSILRVNKHKRFVLAK